MLSTCSTTESHPFSLVYPLLGSLVPILDHIFKMMFMFLVFVCVCVYVQSLAVFPRLASNSLSSLYASSVAGINAPPGVAEDYFYFLETY
jgi:hypothetical protein